MKNLLHIPYPRKPFGSYFGIVICIGLCVNFILMVFQPFGTSSWQHPHKMWILSGYGITIALTGMLFYLISFYVLKRDGRERWNIIAEVLDLFICSICCIIGTYFYYNGIFGGKISLSSLINFLGIGGSVALLPVFVSIFYLYFTWKDVVASQLGEQRDNNSEVTDMDKITFITGQNKTDKIETNLSDLICAKAQDNYVMLFVKKGEKVQKHLIRSTLKKISEQLDSDIIIQTHRSYLVNRNLIQGIMGNKSKAALILTDYDKNIPVSRSMYDTVKNYIIS